MFLQFGYFEPVDSSDEHLDIKVDFIQKMGITDMSEDRLLSYLEWNFEKIPNKTSNTMYFVWLCDYKDSQMTLSPIVYYGIYFEEQYIYFNKAFVKGDLGPGVGKCSIQVLNDYNGDDLPEIDFILNKYTFQHYSTSETEHHLLVSGSDGYSVAFSEFINNYSHPISQIANGERSIVILNETSEVQDLECVYKDSVFVLQRFQKK